MKITVSSIKNTMGGVYNANQLVFNNHLVITSVEELSWLEELVKRDIHAFKVYTNNTRQITSSGEAQADSWAGFVFDIDEGMTIDEFEHLPIAQKYVHVIYASKSHQVPKKDKPACDKFHVFFPYENDVTDAGLVKEATVALVEVYKKEKISIDYQVTKNHVGFFFPSRQSGLLPNEHFFFNIVSDGRSLVTIEYIASHIALLEAMTQGEVNKKLDDKIKKIKLSQEEQINDTMDNVQKAIDVLSKSKIDYEEYLKIGLALATVYGESGRNMFMQFASNPNFPEDNEQKTDRFYSYLLNRTHNMIGVGTIIFIAKRYGFLPEYAVEDFDAVAKVAEMLNINPKVLAPLNEKQICMFFCDGVRAVVQTYDNGIAQSQVILRVVPSGNYMFQMLGRVFPFQLNQLTQETIYGINKTEEGEKIELKVRKAVAAGVDISTVSLNDEVMSLLPKIKTSVYLNNPFKSSDCCRVAEDDANCLKLKRLNRLPVPNMSKTEEELVAMKDAFNDIFETMWGGLEMPIDVIKKYFVQVVFEQRSGKAEHRPILLLRSNKRGSGKTLLAELCQAFFNGRSKTIGDNELEKAEFNAWAKAPFVMFDEVEKNRAKLYSTLKKYTGTQKQEVNEKYGSKGNFDVTFNVAVCSNSRPITIQEFPVSDDLNPFIYLDLDYSPRPDNAITDIMNKYCRPNGFKSIVDAMYHFASVWLWTDGIDIYKKILAERELKHYRYGFAIPIVSGLSTLFEGSIGRGINIAFGKILSARTYSEEYISMLPNAEAMNTFVTLLKQNKMSVKNTVTLLSTAGYQTTDSELVEKLEKHGIIEKGASSTSVKVRSIVDRTQRISMRTIPINSSVLISLFTDEVVEAVPALEAVPEVAQEPVKVVQKPKTLPLEIKPEPQIDTTINVNQEVVQTQAKTSNVEPSSNQAVIELKNQINNFAEGSIYRFSRGCNVTDGVPMYDKEYEVVAQRTGFGDNKYIVFSCLGERNTEMGKMVKGVTLTVL